MKKLLTIIFILFFTGKNLLAQTPHFRNYTVDDGLPSSHVYRAFQDSKGFMWFCTDKGIARFDGYKFEKFTTKNGLPNNDVWQCAEDSEQRIWFLSYANAFFYFDLKDNKFQVIENPFKEYHDAHVWCYVQEGKDKMRSILSNHKSVIIDIGKKSVKKIFSEFFKSYPLIKNIYFRDARNINSYENWHLRVLSEGLQHNILHKPHILPNIKSINPNFWDSSIFMTFYNDKTIYANNDSISFFKNNKFNGKLLKELTNYPNDNLNLILNAGDENKKLVVTEKDMFIIDENLNRIKNYDFIKSFNVNTVFFDPEENLWLCTKNRGVFLLSSHALKSKIFEEFSKQSIATLEKDKFGKIWIGNNLGEVFYINSANYIQRQYFNLEKQSPVKRILTQDDKIIIIWYDTRFAIIQNQQFLEKKIYFKTIEFQIYNNFKFEYIVNKNGKNDSYITNKRNVKAIDVLSDNKLILGTSTNLSILEDKGNKFFLSYIGSNGEIDLKVLALKTIQSEFIYVGTNKGLVIINPLHKVTSISNLKQKYPILTKPISCFADDSQNGLWAGTDGYGVYRFYQNKVIEIPELKGVIINYLYSEKGNNRLWVATNEGIFLLNLNLKTPQLTYTIQKISLAQGLPTLEVNCMVVRDNELFVGTSKGLAMLPIQNIIDEEKDRTQIPLIIKNIKINRQDTTVTNYYDLTYRQNNIDIDFVALSYKSDKNIKYDYKMVSDNADTLWHSVQDLHKEFSLLAPGKYEFSLRAFDINGNASQPIKPIVFIINPPFWSTIWFSILVISLIIGGITLYFYLRTRKIQKEEEQKTVINKKFAELELQALQAQMNPHFVFNALSAIQNFILNNDADEATDYLSRFSRLMRLFLESSRNKYISLSDEKVLLEYYIQLEQLRFKDKFTYQIILEEGVSLDTEIPSMLLQPFVENSINHGLVYKENNDGYLNINFKREADSLICTIDDNGIGRDKAAEIKSKSLKSYKSRGTEITEERLRSLELIENTKIEINIIDKKDENELAIGTKIIIVMYL
jgi:ligand-binding sensor domain-containing protein